MKSEDAVKETMSDRSNAARQSQPQSTMKSSTLKLNDGHEITYTGIGDEKSPLLLFIIGSSGLGSLYHRLTIELSSHFRCVYYDKRGFLPRDTDHGVAAKRTNPLVLPERHADDAAGLIKHLSPDRVAYVFGTSTGGTAALDLTIRYQELVHTAILHEPITFSVIRDTKLKDEMIALYRRIGAMDDPVEAFAIFAEHMFNSPQKSTLLSLDRPLKPEDKSVSLSPIEIYNGRQGHQEAIAMVRYEVDEQKARSISGKLVLVGGMESIELLVSKPGQALAETLGQLRLWELVGDHISFASKKHAARFCEQLLFVLHQEGRISLNEKRSQARM